MRTFIAGDWGTTRLRLFLCDENEVREQRAGNGVRSLTRSAAEEFTALTTDWREQHRVTHAYLSGMIGSRNGWVEVPYLRCPASTPEIAKAMHRFTHADLEISIVPGVSCEAPNGSPDVMRGEETQLIGALAMQPSLQHGRHVVALPGTHTKWAIVENGRIAHFQTALTGELFALLNAHSSLLAVADADGAFDEATFNEASGQRTPSLLHALFQVRSRQLIGGLSAAQARAWLSGLLIGADVDGALHWQHPGEVTLIGEAALTRRYAQVLAARGIEASALDGDACTLAGLRALGA
jgi:2-dehydro-3-deoxygalactonokinase